MINQNATQAYLSAGYSVASPDTAAVSVHRLLRNDKVSRHVQKLQEDLRNRSALTADKVTAELRKLGFWNIQDFLNAGNLLKDLNNLARNLMTPVAGIKSKTITFLNL